MPMTIGNLTSNVNVVDTNHLLTEEMLDKIAQLVADRLKSGGYGQTTPSQQWAIRDRMTQD
jgi:hypothetical protein